MIDIAKGYRQYSPTELREYAYSGIVSCGSTDLTDFLEYIFQGFEKEAEEKSENDYSRGHGAGWDEAVSDMKGYLDNM